MWLFLLCRRKTSGLNWGKMVTVEASFADEKLANLPCDMGRGQQVLGSDEKLAKRLTNPLSCVMTR